MADASLTAVEEAAVALIDVLPRLEAAVVVPASRRSSEGRRPAPGSRPPWNSQVAMVLLDVHQGVRELEQNLRYATAQVYRDQRGGASINTVRCLENLTPLAAGASVAAQRDAAWRLNGWTWRGRIALGEAEPLQRLPAEPGQPEVRCRWCSYTTLRMRPVARLISCINPQCTDAEGRHPVAHMEFGTVYGEPLLIWQDGSVGLPS